MTTYTVAADRDRVDRDAVWRLLSTEAYWGRWREREHLERQIDASWRVVGAWDDATGATVGFARAISDGVDFAYLADVIVDPGHRGHGLGKRIVSTMIDDGPGALFRWTLFTADAHGLYRGYGFVEPDRMAMVRPSRNG